MDVILSKDARKQYESLSRPNQIKVHKKLTALQGDPTAGKKLSGEFERIRSLRAWPYRILYEINLIEDRTEVHKIAHRQGVYR